MQWGFEMKKPLKVQWLKSAFREEASYGDKWGYLSLVYELTDDTTGYAFINGNGETVTKKYKTKAAAKKAAEKWLKEQTCKH